MAHVRRCSCREHHQFLEEVRAHVLHNGPKPGGQMLGRATLASRSSTDLAAQDEAASSVPSVTGREESASSAGAASAADAADAKGLLLHLSCQDSALPPFLISSRVWSPRCIWSSLWRLAVHTPLYTGIGARLCPRISYLKSHVASSMQEAVMTGARPAMSRGMAAVQGLKSLAGRGGRAR